MDKTVISEIADEAALDSVLRAPTFHLNTATQAHWSIRTADEKVSLQWNGNAKEIASTHSLASLERIFNSHVGHSVLPVCVMDAKATETLLDSGVALIREQDENPAIYRDLLWQQSDPWLRNTTGRPYPLRYVMSAGKRHPLRPKKPSGVLYERHIPWLDNTLSFRAIDLTKDIANFHRWMNDPVVAEFWQEEGDVGKHSRYIQAITEDPHVLGLIASLDEVPFAYFEVYWAKEDRIAPFYDADDFDRGWHVLVGEAAYRGRPYVTAWLPSICHYLFLDDCRTQRLVIEPRSDNQKMIRNLEKCGYAILKEFNFPHKRAALGMLQRERFFAEALWNPKI